MLWNSSFDNFGLGKRTSNNLGGIPGAMKNAQGGDQAGTFVLICRISFSDPSPRPARDLCVLSWQEGLNLIEPQRPEAQ